MKRRYVLIGGIALSISQLGVGCNAKQTLKVHALKQSVPPQLVSNFREEWTSSVPLQVTPQSQLSDLFTLLQTWKRLSIANLTPSDRASLVMIGNSWLRNAIAQELIKPLDPGKLSLWSKLPPRCQDLVTYQDKVWGAPYRWGTTAIAYRVDKFKKLGWTPTDWKDLWRPELRDRISLLDNAREVIGLTLKKLGYSYNTPNLDKIPQLKEELRNLNKQVKFYSSDRYLQPLILGDTWLAVGASTDLLSLFPDRDDIAVMIPESGTSLWAELWVIPAEIEPMDLTYQWIDFCWQPKTAMQLSLFTKAASPIISTYSVNELPKSLVNNPLRFPDSALIDKSEFILPLSQDAIGQYRSYWQEMRVR